MRSIIGIATSAPALGKTALVRTSCPSRCTCAEPRSPRGSRIEHSPSVAMSDLWQPRQTSVSASLASRCSRQRNLGSKFCWTKHIDLIRASRRTLVPYLPYPLESGSITELEGAGRRFKKESQRRNIILEGETMRFKWLDSKTLILKSRKELITSLVVAAVVTAGGLAIGSASLASAQDLSRQPAAAEAPSVSSPTDPLP